MLLQACPECGRQYDVRHLDPGQRVRCACERDFAVERPRELRVAAKTCAHCGGPVTPGAGTACPYCNAELDPFDLHGMPCPACFARIDESAKHCHVCGVAIVPQALPPIPLGKRCPRCKGSLALRSLATYALVECQRCSGLWIDPEAFRAACRSAEQGSDPVPFASTAEGGASAPPRKPGPAYIPCIDCGELMVSRQYRHHERPTGVVIDVCRDHGLWLDGRELESILRVIKQRGPEPERRAPKQRPEPIFLPPEHDPVACTLLELVLDALGRLLRSR